MGLSVGGSSLGGKREVFAWDCGRVLFEDIRQRESHRRARRRVVSSRGCANVGKLTKVSAAGVQARVCNRRTRRRVVSSPGCATVGRFTKVSAAGAQAQVCNRRTQRRVVPSPGCATVGELTAGVQPRLQPQPHSGMRPRPRGILATATRPPAPSNNTPAASHKAGENEPVCAAIGAATSGPMIWPRP